MSDQQGFELPRTVLRLEFADPSFDGLLVRAYAPPSWAIEAIGSFAFIDPEAKPTEQILETMKAVRRAFGEALIEWNLCDAAGAPVPATAESVRNLEDHWLSQLIAAWMEGNRQLSRAALAARRVDESQLPMEIG